MDIKSKNNHNRGRLYLILAVLIPALLVMAGYSMVRDRVQDKRVEQATAEEMTYDVYMGDSYVHSIYRSGYVLYQDFQKKASQNAVSSEEIFLPEGSLNQMDEDSAFELREALSEALEIAREDFLNFAQSADYYAMNLAEAGGSESNMAENQSVVESYVKNENWPETAELEKLYPAWICLQYDSAGDLSLLSYHGVQADDFFRQIQELEHRNLLEATENYDTSYSSLNLNSPRDMIVFYGLNYETRDVVQITGVDYYLYSAAGANWLYVLALLAVGLLAVRFMRREKYTLNQSGLFRLPLEITVCGMLIVFALYESLLYTMADYLETGGDFGAWLLNLGAWGIVLALWFWEIACLTPVFSMGPVPYVKQYSLIYRFFPFLKRQWKRFSHYVKDVDLTEHMERSIWKVVLVNGAIVAILCTMWFGGIVGVVIYSVFLFLYLRKYFTEVRTQYKTLLAWVRNMASGNLNAQIPEEVGIFEPLKTELSEIQSGFKSAVEEEVRSQKMKTELITNVSHDLKTPLTAIITYVDLLKREDTTAEERESYIQILEKKSQRLKVLIEDLFEISKATTNNVTLNITDVDIVNLIRQVRFEMEDKISESKLDFRFSLPQEKIVLSLDSQKTYRVFENLIGNILKYALDGSRVYIDLKENELDQVIITLKNISATELNFDPKEITERFVRGDLSRNTEGSGLGLAIARSFVELQGGTLSIEIDGDLFKAVVTFNK